MEIVSKQDVFNLTDEQINTLPLEQLAPYIYKINMGIYTKAATTLETSIWNVSLIVRKKRQSKRWRPRVDETVRDLVKIYIKIYKDNNKTEETK